MSEGRILVIDDSEVVLAKVKSVLTEAGYEVHTTTQTVGAARYLRSVDLVLLDFHMPGIDGAAVLLSLQGAASTSGSSCVFYVYTSDVDLAIRYASFGFDGAIRHKGDDASLVNQVRAALRMRKMRDINRKTRPSTGSFVAINPGRPPSTFPPALTGSTPPPPLTASAPPPPPSSQSSFPPSSIPIPPPPSSRPGSLFERRSAFPPPRPAANQDDDDELTADFPRTPT